MATELTPQTPPLFPSPAGQVDAMQVDKSLSNLQGLTQQLLRERDDLHKMLRQLQSENDYLRSSVVALQEKLVNYAPVLRRWGKSLITPEEAERIFKEDKWVSFEEVMEEVQKVLDQP